MSWAPHILIVDSDRFVREALQKFLRQYGWQASSAHNGKEMRALLSHQTIDLIILDVRIPGEDGLSLCRQLRAESDIPLIMLTTVSEEIECIVGLEMGADDYLRKPCNPRELLARAKAVLRRSRPLEEKQGAASKRGKYRFSGWTLHAAEWRLMSPGHTEVVLSTGEFALLLTFLQHPQQVLSRDNLLDFTKHRSAEPFDRSIDIQVSRLRRKIEADRKHPQLIKTVRGGGYLLATTVVFD